MAYEAVKPLGVLFSGNMALFEKIFRATIEVAGEKAMFSTMPVIPDQLKQMTESVCFPTKPTISTNFAMLSPSSMTP